MSEAKKNSINIEFWIGHLFTLVATVLGVYLAANSGFEKAIEFDMMQRERDSYYVQLALLNEVETNVDAIDSWLTEYREAEDGQDMYLRKEKYMLEYFFWGTTQESSVIFEAPYGRIQQISAFYDTARHDLDVFFSGNPFETPKAAARLQALLNETRPGLIATYREELSEARKDIAKSGLDIEG